ncbi:MAG: hypothetical protein U1F25_06505 [Rubrivivax sp.]
MCLRELTESLPPTTASSSAAGRAQAHAARRGRWPRGAARRGRRARLCRPYKQHIAREEGELLPMASRLLGDAEIERIALAMQRRRGLLP